jgi:thymidylate synthase
MTDFNNEEEYLTLLGDIMTNGIESGDRTGVGTLSVFGRQLRFDLKTSFPLITTKRVAWKPVVSELLWFIEGSGDERRLAEILYGKPREELTDKTTIWTANAQADYWKPKAKFEGDCGRPYGVQWRDWRSPAPNPVAIADGDDFVDGHFHGTRKYALAVFKTVDQIVELIAGIKKDPNGRRHILSAWNPGELDQMVLPPCHVLSQYYVRNGELSCHLFIRKPNCGF